MFNKIKNWLIKFKHWIIFSVLGVGVVLAAGQAMPDKMPEYLELKAPKEKILGHKIIKSNNIRYAYNSDVRMENFERPVGLEYLSENISKRTKRTRTFIKKGEEITQVFNGDPIFFDDGDNWWVAEYATTTQEAFNEQIKSVSLIQFIKNIIPLAYATDTTFYPDLNVESSSVDGSVRYNNASGVSWATAQGATSGTEHQDSGTGGSCGQVEAYSGSGKWKSFFRGFFLFDVSSLSGELVSAVTENFSSDGERNGVTADPALNVYSSNPASNVDLVNDDYNEVGSTAYATEIALSSWATDRTHNIFTFNPTGITAVQSAIDGAGIFKSSTRIVYDATNSEPSWVNDYDNFHCDYADAPESERRPYLVVTHAPAPVISIPAPTYDAWWDE